MYKLKDPKVLKLVKTLLIVVVMILVPIIHLLDMLMYECYRVCCYNNVFWNTFEYFCSSEFDFFGMRVNKVVIIDSCIFFVIILLFILLVVIIIEK